MARKIILAVALVVAFVSGLLLGRCQRVGSETEIVRNVFVDTIPYRMPVAVEENDAGFREIRLPRIIFTDAAFGLSPLQKDRDSIRGEILACGFDSIRASALTLLYPANGVADGDGISVMVKAEQRVYEDSTYRAYVSGVGVSMDSIFVFPRREVVTVRETGVRASALTQLGSGTRKKHWHVGPMVGAGLGRNGFDVFLGLGVSYSLISF